MKKMGGIKFLPRGASKYTPPPPSPLKNLLWPEIGGGGVYNFSLGPPFLQGSARDTAKS